MVRSELRRNPLVFVSDLSVPEIKPEDRAHLERSLRLRAGDRVTIGDGRGGWQQAVMGDVIETIAEPEFEDRPSPSLTVGFSLVKGERSDLVVQKLTELGIDHIAPIVSERCVVRWDETKAIKNLGRHHRIVREAAMQSRNLWLPTVHKATSFRQFCSLVGEQVSESQMVLAEPGGSPLASTTTAIVIGPEGGFSPAELEGQVTASLPGRVLRSETAAITAAVLLSASRTGR